MSEEEDNNSDTGIEKPKKSPSMGKDWGSGLGSGRTRLFEKATDLDIYCDRERGANYIFHGPELNCTIDHMEYDHDTQRIDVYTKDGQKLDLGIKIQWLVRPYISREQFIFVIRTKDGQAIDGVEVLLKIKDPHAEKNNEKTLN